MLHHNSRGYQIEECRNTPKRFALDRKEPMPNGHVCLNNIGWYDCLAHALTAMANDIAAHAVNDAPTR